MTVLTREEGRSLLAKKKRANKYNAQKVTVDGITFDSKAEAKFYAELKLLEASGLISNVELQPTFAFVQNGQLIGTYRADFQFWDVTQKRVRVVDVKGVETAVFRLKRRMMRAFHGIEVEVVK